MKVKIQNLLICFCLLLGLQSCFSDDEIKIGLSVHGYESERWKKDETLFSKKVSDLGGTTIVKVANGDPLLQVKQCQELISEGVKVLVVIPEDSEIASEIVDLAHKAGIKVIAYDRLIKNSDLDYYISFDNVKVGELQAEYLIRRKPKGNYAIIGGAKSDNNAFLFRTGQLNVLKPYEERGDIKIVFDELTDAWTEQEAYKAMEKCFAITEKIDAAVVSSDDLVPGVIRSLKERGLEGKVPVTGQDASLVAGKLIMKGELAMTIYKPLEAIAFTAAITAVKLAKNEPVRNAVDIINNGKVDVPSILLSPIVVDKDNILTTVVADGFLKEEELFGL